MATIPKKVTERFTIQVRKYQRILKKACDRDINEADTVVIVNDVLSDIFGFDRYEELTGEYAIKGTYCDLAVKIDGEVKYLIEVKSVSTDLKDPHLRQAINYGALKGIQWIILTNGIIWQIYNLQLKGAIQHDKIIELNFLEINPRKKKDQETLFLLAREGLTKDVISEYHERVKCVNKFMISAVITNKSGIDLIKRELRKANPGLKIDDAEIESILMNEMIKRNILESDEFQDAQKRIKRAHAKAMKKKNKA